MDKITNKSALNFVIETYGESLPSDIKEKLSAMVVALEKKSAGERKPTATQVENARVGEAILEHLRISNAHMTITDMIKTIPECADMTTQKVSPMVKRLGELGKVAKETIKGRTYFYAVGE